MPRPLTLTLALALALALAVNHGSHPLFAPRTSESLPIALTIDVHDKRTGICCCVYDKFGSAKGVSIHA
jgi:hypothetical protein